MAALAPPRLPPEAIERGFAKAAFPCSSQEARAEANRCLLCHDAPCTRACPAHVDIPAFVHQIATDDPGGAGCLVLEANPLAATCARVCPASHLCESACVLAPGQPAVAVARLEGFAAGVVLERGELPCPRGPRTGRRVGVVGGSAAGLACAITLARLGDAVVILEAPGVRLPEARLAAALGVEFRAVRSLPEDVPADSLLLEFDAVFLGMGPESFCGPRPGQRAAGARSVLDRVEPARLWGYSGPATGRRQAKDGPLHWFASPLPGTAGSQRPPRSRVAEVGGDPPPTRLASPPSPAASSWLEALGVRVRHGRIVTDPATGRTSNPRIFAAGPCATGRATVVHAVRDARIAAGALHLTVSPGCREGRG